MQSDGEVYPQDQASLVQRASEELELQLISQKPEFQGVPRVEALAIYLDRRTREGIRSARAHIYGMGAALYVMRETQAYRNHPAGYQSFKEWVEQPEMGLTMSRASDIINFWRYVMPAARRAGIEPNQLLEIDETKLRGLVAPIRDGERKGGLSSEDVRDLVSAAERMTREGFRQMIRPSSTHEPPTDNPAYEGHLEETAEDHVLYVKAQREGEDRIRAWASFSDDEFVVFLKRTRARLVDPKTGEFLRPADLGIAGFTAEDYGE